MTNYFDKSLPLGTPVYGCSFGTAIKRFFQGYVKFSGRASKSEYWFAFLFCISIDILWWFASRWILSFGSDTIIVLFALDSVAAMFLFNAAILLPVLAIGWRRLQDVKVHGTFALLILAIICVFILHIRYVAIFGLVWGILIGFLPTKTAEQGNKYADSVPNQTLTWPLESDRLLMAQQSQPQQMNESAQNYIIPGLTPIKANRNPALLPFWRRNILVCIAAIIGVICLIIGVSAFTVHLSTSSYNPSEDIPFMVAAISMVFSLVPLIIAIVGICKKQTKTLAIIGIIAAGLNLLILGPAICFELLFYLATI